MSALTPAVANDVFRVFPQSPPDNVGVGKKVKTNSVQAVILQYDAL
jgi:hypothetical protein